MSGDYIDLIARLRDGTVMFTKRWSGDTFADLGGGVDEEATDAVMEAAADAIEALTADVADERDLSDDSAGEVLALAARVASLEAALRELADTVDEVQPYVPGSELIAPLAAARRVLEGREDT